ncbi:MAG: CusA/CzcA family heavy metal efflux RND transporter [Planctomycetota bacterium]|nr:MAG: CusA/CzcA family heavy metal efflux RND transporter [Planctomycetota bacterium]
MLNWIINWSLRRRMLVVGITLGFVVAGMIAISHLNIDAFPDTTPVQVQINTVAPALGPEEVERQITIPVEQSISGLPGLKNVRSISKFGLSQVVVTFEDGIDIYFARRLIGERLSTVELPAGITLPEMGPVATGLGEVFHYIVTSETRNLTELRTIQDWTIKPVLRAVPGVAEINSWGGLEKQYQVRIDPNRLIKYGLSYDEVIEALEQNNLNAGGGSIGTGGAMQLVQGIGRVVTLDQIGDIVIKAQDGIPIHVHDVADVQVGAEIRRGAVTYGGGGEAVLGLGFMLMGQNTHEVTSRLKEKLEEIKKTLPADVHVETVYDRTELVDHVIDTVRKNLFEGGLLVIAVLFMFLGNLRAGLIVAMAIPLSMLFAFSGMLQFAIAGSLMSLGAIDFGLVVDSAVIQIENATRHIAHDRRKRPLVEVVRDAVLEVRKPTMFGELIIALVYAPILALEGIEGKLFRPMALTVIFALAGSLVLSLTLMPVLASLLLPRRMEERDPLLVRLARRAYAPVLQFVMRHNVVVLALAVCVLGFAAVVARGLGTEFIPRLSEGAIVANVVRLAGTDLDESVRYNTQMERALLSAFPDEIRHVWSRIGTAEVATDPMGVELTDIFLSLTPRSQWKRAETQTELVELMLRELRDMPGQRVAMTQPIEMRMNEMIAGVRGDVALKLYGDDLDILKAKGNEIGAILGSIRGAADLSTEQLTGQPVLQIRVDQEAIARHGVPAKAVMDLVESIGSKPLGEVIEGQLRFPLVARLPDAYRRDIDAVRAVVLPTASGQRVPLATLAAIEEVEGPSTITREWGQRRTTIQVNVRGRDMGGYVAEAQQRLAKEVELPPGRYRVEWGGQFENYDRARNRLLIVVPGVLVMIFVLLYVTYNRVLDAIRVFTGVPFAVVGGAIALWVRDMPFSISAAVGFIALSGVAVLGDMVLVSYVRQLLAGGASLREAISEAATTRLRPVLMTALVASLGFVPMALSTGVGAEVQRPLATVVIGGVISSTLLTLLVLPAIYLVFGAVSAAKAAKDAEGDDALKRPTPALESIDLPTPTGTEPVHA